MFTYSVWIPSERLHTIKELHKLARARFAQKEYTFKPYSHVKGKIAGSMHSDKYSAAMEDIRVAGLPDYAPNLEEALRAMVYVIPQSVAA